MNITTEFKSITSHRLCIVFLLVLITITISVKRVDAKNKYIEIINDLPRKEDLETYLKALEDIVSFCEKHKNTIDLNFEFGLFLINVNWRTILANKWNKLPVTIRKQMERIIRRNTKLGLFFRDMVRKKESVIKQSHRADSYDISKLLNETFWPRNLIKFNTDLAQISKPYTLSELQDLYGDWSAYKNNLYGKDTEDPSPLKSDFCLGQLADLNAAAFHTTYHPRCNLPGTCRSLISHGSKVGYKLTHRALLLLLTNFARNCAVNSVEKDKASADEFCVMIYGESEYIAANDFQEADMLCEQMVICGQLGNAQFLRRSWLARILEHQTKFGCFTNDRLFAKEEMVVMPEDRDEAWVIENEHGIMQERCNGHFTGTGAAVIALAVRYILETQY